MNVPKLAYLAMAGLIAFLASPVMAQQNPDSTPITSTATAPAAATPDNADEAAALIAKANAAAAANAKAVATTATALPTKNAPSADARKKAQQFGFHTEIYNGKTMFCKDDATLGTRLTSKKCMDAIQFEDYAVQLQIARDLMKQKGQCQGGGICGALN